MCCANNGLISALPECMHGPRLEKETGLYFDLKYLEDLLIAGKFDEAESYLLAFTNWEDNMHSAKLFFEIRKQKYLEALDRYELSFSLFCLQTHFGLLGIAFSFLDAEVLWIFLSFSYLMIMGFFIVLPLVIARNNGEHFTQVEYQYLESLLIDPR